MSGRVARYYRDRDGRVFERVSPGRYRRRSEPPGFVEVRRILPNELSRGTYAVTP